MKNLSRESEIVRTFAQNMLKEKDGAYIHEVIHLDNGHKSLAMDILKVVAQEYPMVLNEINYALVLALQPEDFTEMFPIHMRYLDEQLKEHVDRAKNEGKFLGRLDLFPAIFLKSLAWVFINSHIGLSDRRKVLYQLGFLTDAVNTETTETTSNQEAKVTADKRPLSTVI